ncbi:tail sheat protein [Yersinia phage fHe-Yen8-01]|nr:tail sheat protein [Yersinia phage fHe-Yen8-01]
MPVFFNGQLLTTPTTASAVNDDAMLNQNLTVGNAIAYIGVSNGGKSKELLSFGSPDEARRVLVSGELYDAVTAAFAPSQETGAAQTVHAIRVNRSDAAKLDLISASTTQVGAVFGTVYGTQYTKDDQLTRVKVEAGSAAGNVTITVAGKQNGQDWSFTGTDINAPRIHIEILKAQCTVTTAGNSIAFVTDLNGGEGIYQKIEMFDDQYLSLGDVADHANIITNNAGEVCFTVTFDNEADRALPITVLDKVALTEVKNNNMPWCAYTIPAWFATLEPVSFALNTAANVDQVYFSGLKVMDYKYLSRPAVQAPTINDWKDALAMLETKDIQWVQVVSGNPQIHAMVNSHVTVTSNVLRRERRTICGTVAGVTDDFAIAAAKSLNSKRASLCHIGYYDYNAAGKLALLPPYMTAGLVAAGFAGVNPGTPLTNKSLMVQGLERDLRNPTDTDKLLKGGVMPIENTDTGYKVTQSITTWLGDSKYNNREQSCGVAIDFTVRNVRNALDQVRGSKQSPILLSRALELTKSQLVELAKPEPMGPAVLVGDENSPAWRNVSGTVEGDVLRIQFEASPAIPNNYILVTMYARPYSGSATA